MDAEFLKLNQFLDKTPPGVPSFNSLEFMARTIVDSLMGNLDCGHSTMRKFSNFPSSLILREINFG